MLVEWAPNRELGALGHRHSPSIPLFVLWRENLLASESRDALWRAPVSTLLSRSCRGRGSGSIMMVERKLLYSLIDRPPFYSLKCLTDTFFFEVNGNHVIIQRSIIDCFSLICLDPSQLRMAALQAVYTHLIRHQNTRLRPNPALLVASAR